MEKCESMAVKPLHSGVRFILEYGPIIGFVVTYLMFRHAVFEVRGTAYSGFVAVTAVFVPIFVVAIGLLWLLSGKVPRLQVATALMFVVFGGMSVWLNDARLIKMKPTVIYTALALILGAGLIRGQSWLKYIVEGLFPMKRKGWMILTKRLTGVFVVSALANEAVWRT